MKNAVSIVAALCCFVIAVTLGVLYATTAMASVEDAHEIARLKNSETLLIRQTALLQDQLRDYEYRFMTAKTYEEGYRDAVIRRLGGSYSDGFFAAQTTYRQGTYADGYHTAMEQVGTVPMVVTHELPVSDEASENLEEEGTSLLKSGDLGSPTPDPIQSLQSGNQNE